MSTLNPDRILISPLYDLESDLSDRLCREIARVFGYPTGLQVFLNDIEFAFSSDRLQYHSTPILDKLAHAAPPEALKVLGVVDVDLFIPILTHVYGEAQLGGRACLVSTYRLKEEIVQKSRPDEFKKRLLKEAVHELGHTFSLHHCEDPSCIMHYCRSLADVDRKSMELCRYCRIMLDDEVKRISGIGK